MANYWHLVAGACDVLLMINKSFDHTGGVKKMFYLLGNRWDSNVGPFGPQLNERFNHLIGYVLLTYFSMYQLHFPHSRYTTNTPI